MTEQQPDGRRGETSGQRPSELLGGIVPWTHEELGEVAATRIFTLRRRRCESVTHPGRGGEFVYLDCPDWVNVVAITPDRELVMIEQFRYGTLEVTLELPGGMVDPGEDPLPAGVRELVEETGFEPEPGAAGASLIGRFGSNPPIMNNDTHVVLVPRAVPTGVQSLDPHEEIVVRCIPLERLDGLIASGIIRHSIVLAALCTWRVHSGG